MAKKDKNRYLLPSERQVQPEAPKKERKGFKGFLKYTGVFFLAIVVIFGIGLAGAFITGRFDPEKIHITNLTINNEKEYVAISDNDTSFKCKVDFAPANANQLVLTSQIRVGTGLISEMPQVVAGEEFEIKFAKDEHGITKGGEIEIKFITSNQSSQATLKVLIDVGLNSNYVSVESSGTEEYDAITNTLSTKVSTTITEEYCEEIKISALNDSMFNAYNGAWSDSEKNEVANLNRLKKTILFYDEEDTSIVGFGEDNKLMVEEHLGNDKYYKIRFLSPASSLQPFEFQLYIYKTYHMETIFSEELATSILRAFKENSYRVDDIDYPTLNAFINKYVYNAASVSSKDNFALFVNTNNGLIELSPSKIPSKGLDNFKRALTDVLDYVFVGKKVLITIENVVVEDIVNTNDELKIKVLEDTTYTIADVRDTLGITLEAEDGATADPQVLFNNLRKLDIMLVELVDYRSGTEKQKFYSWLDEGIEESVRTTPHYYIDYDGDHVNDEEDRVFKKVTHSDEIELVKEIKNGEATWTLRTLSPTPAAGKYYLLYRYRNNDVTEHTITNSETGTSTKYILKNDIWHRSNNAIFTNSSSNKVSEALCTLENAVNDKFAVASIDVTWTKGKIAYNENTSIKNSKKSTFVLNREDTLYTYDGTYQKLIEHGSNNGVYYTFNDRGEAYNSKGEPVLGRTFTIGEGTNNTENNVLINPVNAGETLEYTMVKWFVPYYKNIIGGTDSDGNIVYDDSKLNVAQYYFLPVLDNTYEDNTDGTLYYNPIPAKVKLNSVENPGTYLGGSTSYFMEIGTGNMTIQALNAMAEDLDIPLYAVIIQTNIDNEPFFIDGDIVDPEVDSRFTAPTVKTYHYIAYTYENESKSGHSLNVRYYVEELKIYISGAGKNSSGYEEVSDTKTITINPPADGALTGTHGYFYLSNIDLYEHSQNTPDDVIYPSDEIYIGTKILLHDGINNLRNAKIALYNYYLGFASGTNRSYIITAANEGYPNGNSVSMGTISLISGGSDAWDIWSIKYEIIANSIGDNNTYSYNFRIDYLDNNYGIKPPTSQSSSINFYTQVKPSGVGIVQLKPATSPSS